MKYFELVIPNTTPETYAADLAADIANLPPANVTLGDGDVQEVVEIDFGKSQVIPPNETYPHYKLEIYAVTWKATRQTSTYPPSRLKVGNGRQLGIVISADFRKMTDESIRFSGQCTEYMAVYMSIWLQQAIATYEARPVSTIAGVEQKDVILPVSDNAPPPGRKPIPREEEIDRLAARMAAEELRRRNPGMTWKEAAALIPEWSPRSTKLLQQDAGDRLTRAKKMHDTERLNAAERQVEQLLHGAEQTLEKLRKEKKIS